MDPSSEGSGSGTQVDSALAWATVLRIDLGIPIILIIRLFSELFRIQIRKAKPKIFPRACVAGLFVGEDKTEGDDVIIHGINFKACVIGTLVVLPFVDDQHHRNLIQDVDQKKWALI